jgi:hypothetical protein
VFALTLARSFQTRASLVINNPCPQGVAQTKPHRATIAKRFSALAPIRLREPVV